MIQPNSTSSILLVGTTWTIGEEASTGSLDVVDGLVGEGQPVDVVVTEAGASKEFTVESKEVALAPEVTCCGAAYNVAVTGQTQREDPAIRAWAAADPNVVLTETVLPADGLLLVASLATDLGNGIWHYEYAVQNLTSHRSVRSFTVPVSQL